MMNIYSQVVIKLQGSANTSLEFANIANEMLLFWQAQTLADKQAAVIQLGNDLVTFVGKKDPFMSGVAVQTSATLLMQSIINSQVAVSFKTLRMS